MLCKGASHSSAMISLFGSDAFGGVQIDDLQLKILKLKPTILLEDKEENSVDKVLVEKIVIMMLLTVLIKL